MRWPDREPYAGAYLELGPSWQEFWGHPPQSGKSEVAALAPLDEFLVTMRRTSKAPKIRIC